jgi:hypothetical protein
LKNATFENWAFAMWIFRELLFGLSEASTKISRAIKIMREHKNISSFFFLLFLHIFAIFLNVDILPTIYS